MKAIRLRFSTWTNRNVNLVRSASAANNRMVSHSMMRGHASTSHAGAAQNSPPLTSALQNRRNHSRRQGFPLGRRDGKEPMNCGYQTRAPALSPSLILRSGRPRMRSLPAEAPPISRLRTADVRRGLPTKKMRRFAHRRGHTAQGSRYSRRRSAPGHRHSERRKRLAGCEFRIEQHLGS